MKLNYLSLESVPILKQLQIEEALMRTSEENWCIVNHGSPPAIVMGLASKPHEMVNLSLVKQKPVPLIKRFSGGGTVYIDEETLFVTFLFQKKTHNFPAFPERIMRWSDDIYQNMFPNLVFKLNQNDYVIKDKKCGGNAQYIKKDCWLHHTSFLWDFNKENMDYLTYPKRVPEYRNNRSHEDFLCCLNKHIPSKKHFFESLKKALKKRYHMQDINIENALSYTKKEHRKATMVITP